MKTPHLCFVIDCRNTVLREDDDFENLYCPEHDFLNGDEVYQVACFDKI